MSVTLVFQAASGDYSATSGRVLEVSTLGDSPTVLETFLYSTLTFFTSGNYSIATGSITGAVTGNYYAYQWGNAGGWSLESPWVRGSGRTVNTCLVYGESYHLDGTAASGTTVTAAYNDTKGNLIGGNILGTKTEVATVASDGSWSMELLQGAKVKFTHSANSKLNCSGTVPSSTTASVSSFAENI
jgi:hypothetical protein